MKLRIFSIAPLALVFVLSNSMAAESKVDKAVSVVKELCLTGTQFDLKVDVNGNLSLKKITPGVNAVASVNVRNSSGAAAIFDDEVRRIADEDIRSCIKPYISQIINSILEEGKYSKREAESQKKSKK
ncbi:hypothetical protein [Janthinobacterium violaceinigrum]|uniref:Uncharacterized protein n=1 Tax=Janthinobacterium violaceinigrum TaxID=2654252 RepID=A0A6I1IFA5_9BURK|nr:hypothetical protein [Janthinobacterium violaceinigrum]KAB8062961.1 hypothetical protein GCN75_20850 [Janthinobacterium violaceinigrum]